MTAAVPRRAAGLAPLTALAVQRDRVLVPVWSLVLAAVAGVSVAATAALYPTGTERAAAAAAIDAAPALRAVYGPVASTGLGALALWKLGVLGAVGTALLVGLTVVRHTRAEEEDGRLELLAATRIGRSAPAAAALVVGLGTAALVTVATALTLVGVGLSVAGSVAFAACWGAAGAVGGGVALVAAQVGRTARTARALLVATLLVAYVLRAVGDGGAGPTWLVWTSPLGWIERVGAFGTHRWALLFLPLALAAALGTTGLVLHARRDVGAGLVADRAGPAHASRRLRSPLGLAWRLHRAALVGWAAGFVVLGALFGSVAGDLAGLLDSPMMRDAVTALGGTGALTDAFLAAEFGLLAGVASLVVVGVVLRAVAEERSGRLDAVLAAPVDVLRWVAGHVGLGVAGGIVLLGLAAVAAGLPTGETARLLGAAMGQAPGLVVAAGLALVFYGVAPGHASAAWFVVAAVVLAAELGPLLGAPTWLMDLVPTTHLPHLPGGPVDVLGWVGVLGVGAALLVLGGLALRRRDVAGT